MILSAQAIIDYANTNNITIKHEEAARRSDNMMCASYVVIHMSIGDDSRDFDMWSGNWDKRILYKKTEIRALEVGFENYAHHSTLYPEGSSEYDMMMVGMAVRQLIRKK